MKGKVAIVTGASKGIGAGIAKGLAAEGVAVVVNYVNSKTDADRVVADITSKGGKAVAIQGNVAVAADVERLFAAAKEAFGEINILVNNAGIFKFGPVEAITEADFHQHFTINVLGPILTTQEALKYFPASGGSIINISSVAGSNPGAYASLYASTKAAIDAITISLAKELAARNIRVNAVAPGNTETQGAHDLGIFGTEIEKTMIAATPMGRFGQPEDIAGAVVFFASDASSWLTGERVRASGGMH
jgi:3-oxoacyl-[acyl-carrier protein] reductase